MFKYGLHTKNTEHQCLPQRGSSCLVVSTAVNLRCPSDAYSNGEGNKNPDITCFMMTLFLSILDCYMTSFFSLGVGLLLKQTKHNTNEIFGDQHIKTP